jgi:hypothetical protein
MITGSLPLRGGQLASYRAPSMHPPVDDGEHQLQVLCDLRSSALMHFRDDASAAQRAADESGIVPHALVRLLRSEALSCTMFAVVVVLLNALSFAQDLRL